MGLKIKNIKLSTLKKLYSALEETNIPSFSGNEALDDWVEDLIELDANLAGLACSLLGGAKLFKREIPLIENLSNSFLNLAKNNELKGDDIKKYEKYLQLLENIQNELLFIVKSHKSGQ